MKKRLINSYYNFLMWIEDIFSAAEKNVNNHRKRVDEKYWDKYFKPNAALTGGEAVPSNGVVGGEVE